MKHSIKVSVEVSQFFEIEAESHWDAVVIAANMLRDGKLKVNVLQSEVTSEPRIDPTYKDRK